jgi:hypothetical protein
MGVLEARVTGSSLFSREFVFTAIPHPGGMKEISRGLSASDYPRFVAVKS